MNEIKICDTATLTNKKLTTQVNKMFTALKTMERNKWQFAESVANIMTNELYIDDFETDKAFADYLNVSKSYISRITRCVDYHTIDVIAEWTISKVQEVIGIPKEDIPSFISNYKLTADSTVKEIRNAVKIYCDGTGENADELDNETTEDNDNVIDVEPTEEVTALTEIKKEVSNLIARADNDMIFRIYDLLKMNGVL